MFQKNKRVIGIIIVILCITLMLSGCTQKNPEQESGSDDAVISDVKPVSKDNETEDDKVRIGYLAIPGNVLYFLANDLGYFAEENIEAELSMFKSSSEGVAALMSDKIDTGCFGTTAIVAVVDENGVVTAVGRGNARIICSAEDGFASAECEITVDFSAWQYIVYYVLFGWAWY